jgi:hypothetical protein
LRRELIPLYALAAAVVCAAGGWYLLKELAPLLRPLILALLWALGYLLGQLLLSAGLMALAALALAGRRVTLGPALGMATRSSLRLLRFGAKQLVALAVIFAPFLGLAGLTYGLLLTGHDINYYLAEEPPALLAAVAIGVVLGGTSQRNIPSTVPPRVDLLRRGMVSSGAVGDGHPR